MNEQRRSFYRKIAYACTIVALLFPLSYLSHPATTEKPGGILAQKREEYKLSQANLGDIDPASETIKLATLGMRGIAVNLLWDKANYFKKVEDWTSLSATLEQITKLQPNFIAVWRFQAWNLSYNVSVEFDNYHDRYYWVIRGINFLKEGTKYNANDSRLLWDLGWFIAQKIGRADEHVQYRQLFKEDDDFHNADRPGRTLAEKDNWLVGKEKFLMAQELVDHKGVPVKGTSELIFHSSPPMSQINYSDAIEEDGIYGEVAQAAWNKAGKEWQEYGARDIPSSFNVTIHLNEQEEYERRAAQAQKELESLAPADLPAQLKQKKIDALKREERDLLDATPAERSDKQNEIMMTVEEKIAVTPLEIAEAVPKENRRAALAAAEAVKQAKNVAGIIDRYRDIVNFNYWRLRCQFERTDNALAARKLVHEGDQAFAGTKLDEAVRRYDEGFRTWRKVIDEFPQLLKQKNFTEDLVEAIEKYRKILGKADIEFPQKFILQDVIDADHALEDPSGQIAAAQAEAKKSEANKSEAPAEK